MSLAIQSSNPTPQIDRKRLKTLAKKLLRAEHRLETAEISLMLCDDPTIRDLNRDYRGQDKPTDVLSFPQERGPALPLGFADEEIPHALGDVVISLETAQRQAEAQGWELQEEVEALLAHGIFHLLGYDHSSPEEQSQMRDRETALLGEKSIWIKAALHEDVEEVIGAEATA